MPVAVPGFLKSGGQPPAQSGLRLPSSPEQSSMPGRRSRGLRTLGCLIMAGGTLLGSANCGRLPDPYVVKVTARDFQWHIRYPGRDGDLGTEDDRTARQDLHLPANTNVRLRLESRDYIYTLSVPELGLREMAVPGLTVEIPFATGPAGVFALRGDPMCGFFHRAVAGDLVVESRSRFDKWLARP